MNTSRTLKLAALFLITYFTHLIGFGLAVLSAGCIASASRKPLKSVLCVAVAGIPALLLTGDYLARSHAAWPNHTGAWEQLVAWQTQHLSWTHVWNELWQVNDHLFGVVEPFGPPVLGISVLLLLEIIVLCGLLLGRRSAESKTLVKSALLALSLIVASLYFLLPEALIPHGSYLQLRWTAIPPVLWLACCRLPDAPILRRIVVAAIWAVSVANLVAITLHFRRCNAELTEYCSGIPESGMGNLLLQVQPSSHELLVDHLSHAACYYCLTTGNVLVDNYEAYNPHFPVRFLQPPARRGRTADEYIAEFHPEVLVFWKQTLEQLQESDRVNYREVFHQGRLMIARRVASPEMPSTRE